ncbi:hypothetical protein EMPS_06294 [Entomortierella parvispora]|uniref:WHIM2 domain-containing protein n=1 Tax=Entomortierella parvispora TaxID=205924 RepID=A0A9P3HC97_9FUNG|nr:hypothetical protein EMPS_06294 [Entomortierella parvispora]
MGVPHAAGRNATHLTRLTSIRTSNTAGAAHSTDPRESGDLSVVSPIASSQNGPLEPETSASKPITPGQIDHPGTHPLLQSQVYSILKGDQRHCRNQAAQQEKWNIYSDTPQVASRSSTKAFLDDPRQEKKAKHVRSHPNAQTSMDNNGGADTGSLPIIPVRVSVDSLSPDQARVNMKVDSISEAPIDRSIPFEDPGLCHVRDIFFCYAFVARFFGTIRQACVGMPLEMYRFEVLKTALLSRRRMRMLDSINCAIINLIVADDPKGGNVNFSTFTKYLERMQLDLRSTDPNALDYENPFLRTDNYYDIPPLTRVKLLATLVEQALERSSYIKEQIETWYAENEGSRIREEPFGYDRYGRAYWVFDKRSMMIFRETKYTDAWECISKSLRDVRRLVSYFTKTNNVMEESLRQRLIEEVIRPEKKLIIMAKKAQAHKIKAAQAQDKENAEKIEAMKISRNRPGDAIETRESDSLSDILDSDYDDPSIEEKALSPSPDNPSTLPGDLIDAGGIEQWIDNDRNIMDAFGNRYKAEYLNYCFDGWLDAVVIPTRSAKAAVRLTKASDFLDFQ